MKKKVLFAALAAGVRKFFCGFFASAWKAPLLHVAWFGVWMLVCKLAWALGIFHSRPLSTAFLVVFLLGHCITWLLMPVVILRNVIMARWATAVCATVIAALVSLPTFWFLLWARTV